MTIRVGSGNSAVVQILTSDTGAVVDVEWLNQPSRQDKRDLERVLRLGDRAMSVHVEDDAERAALVRGVLSSSQEVQ